MLGVPLNNHPTYMYFIFTYTMHARQLLNCSKEIFNYQLLLNQNLNQKSYSIVNRIKDSIEDHIYPSVLRVICFSFETVFLLLFFQHFYQCFQCFICVSSALLVYCFKMFSIPPVHMQIYIAHELKCVSLYKCT